MLLPSAMLPERATPEAPQGWWQAHLHLLDLLWGHFPTAGGARAEPKQQAGFAIVGSAIFLLVSI